MGPLDSHDKYHICLYILNIKLLKFGSPVLHPPKKCQKIWQGTSWHYSQCFVKYIQSLRLLNRSPKEISWESKGPTPPQCQPTWLNKALLRDHGGSEFLTNAIFLGEWGRQHCGLVTLQLFLSFPTPGYQSRHQKGCLAVFFFKSKLDHFMRFLGEGEGNI